MSRLTHTIEFEADNDCFQVITQVYYKIHPKDYDMEEPEIIDVDVPTEFADLKYEITEQVKDDPKLYDRIREKEHEDKLFI